MADSLTSASPLERVRANPVVAWALVFVLVNILCDASAKTNPLSRFSTLSAMSRQQTFVIDDFLYSVDWAKSPDGHYYSNKAPGPMFLAFPLFGLLDRTAFRSGPSEAHQRIISIVFQAIPYAILVMLCAEYLRRRSVPQASIHFAALAMLFGNTAAIYMNTFFGHGMAAGLLLACVLSVLTRHYGAAGLFYGLTLLSDYSAALILPFLLIAMVQRHSLDLRWVVPFVAGGLLPAALWVWYHTSAFGSPLSIAPAFTNPMFVARGGGNLQGQFVMSLRGEVILMLLFGSVRGVLFTQPWVLLLVPVSLASWWGARRSQGVAQLTLLGVGGLSVLLLMNSSFGNWHGGGSSGPRYLSMIFPVLALLAGLLLSRLPKPLRATAWFALGLAVIFTGLVYATGDVTAPVKPLWPTLVGKLFTGGMAEPWLRLAGYWLLLFVGLLWTLARQEELTATTPTAALLP